MTTATLTNWDKAAILLRALSPGSNQEVLKQLDPDQAARLRRNIERIEKRPDLKELTQQVLREFRQLCRPSSGSGETAPRNAHSANWVAQRYGDAAHMTEKDSATASESPSGRVISDDAAALANVAPAVLAKVLQAESQRVLTLVLQKLPSETAATVLKLLPADARGPALSMLAAGPTFPEPVVQRVLRTVREQCAARPVEAEAVLDEDAQVKRLVGILQGIDREERLRLLGVLGEQNETVAAKIDDQLYDFPDLLRIEDRSLQKILTQTDQKTLAIALKTAPDEIKDKVMRNMSERVRAALAEEMEFLGVVPNAKCEAARKDITAIIRAQDKEGSLVWLDE